MNILQIKDECAQIVPMKMEPLELCIYEFGMKLNQHSLCFIFINVNAVIAVTKPFQVGNNHIGNQFINIMTDQLHILTEK